MLLRNRLNLIIRRNFTSSFPLPVNKPPDLRLREDFVVPPTVNFGRWFPKHMHVGLKKMEGRLVNVDCIIEVHDARIPLSGRNRQFLHSLYAIRPHILVLNKEDLIYNKQKEPVERILREEMGIKHLIWTNCKLQKKNAITKLLRVILEQVEETPRYNRIMNDQYLLMVIGVPNVGKSSLINALRGQLLGKKAASKIGDRPGVTRTVMERVKIFDDPPVYILDTPGVLGPSAKDVHSGMKLATCDTILQTSVGPLDIADYLLFWLNRMGRYQYVRELGLKCPTDNIQRLLLQTCMNFDLKKHIQMPGEGHVWKPDLSGAAERFVGLFKRSRLGDQFLDADVLQSYANK